MFVDLDRFKLVNETLGDVGGDRLLRQVAERIKECLRASDTVARLGGDEFAIILSRLQRADDAVVVARKLLSRVAQAFEVDGNQVHITASIGISVFPVDGGDPVELLKDADIAMYHAKDESRNSYRFFSTDMQADAQSRMRLEKDLRQALEAHEFILPLSAADQSRDRFSDGPGGPGEVAAPGAGHGVAGRVHSRGGGQRPDRSARRVGAS